VVAFGSLGAGIGPVLVGSLSTAVGLPGALSVPALLVLLAAAAAPVLRAPRTATAASEPQLAER
jgi:hypothetical protein